MTHKYDSRCRCVACCEHERVLFGKVGSEAPDPKFTAKEFLCSLSKASESATESSRALVMLKELFPTESVYESFQAYKKETKQ